MNRPAATDPIGQRLQEVYHRLYARFGPQYWWPGNSRCEVLVGAVLAQNVAWHNVQLAMDNLRQADRLTIAGLRETSADTLAELIRPAGTPRVKQRRLRHLVDFVVDHYDGSLDAMFRCDTKTLRKELLRVHGIGPETADCILLYAGHRPTFIADEYARRVMRRHGWVPASADYAQVRAQMQRYLPEDAMLFNEYHALIVATGKQYCRVKPQCTGCPLEPMLPGGGPVDDQRR